MEVVIMAGVIVSVVIMAVVIVSVVIMAMAPQGGVRMCRLDRSVGRLPRCMPCRHGMEPLFPTGTPRDIH
jgi:hypothetical protein